MAVETLFRGPDGTEDVDAVFSLLEDEILPAQQFRQALALEIVQRADLRVSQLVHAGEVLREVDARLGVLEQTHQFDAPQSPRVDELPVLFAGHLTKVMLLKTCHHAAIFHVSEARRVQEVD